MSLLDPSPGEVIDRLTIISLKLGFNQDPELERTLTAERDALTARLDLTHIPLGSKVFQLWRGLDVVNSRIWHREDEIRQDPALRAQTTQPLNDTRARLSRKIDQDLGIVRPREKLWMKEEEEKP